MAEPHLDFLARWRKVLPGALRKHVTKFADRNALDLRLRVDLDAPASPRASAPQVPEQGRPIAAEVLKVLRKAMVGQDAVKLQQQLSPELYKKVAQTLELLGAKWDRKREAHVFQHADAFDDFRKAVASGIGPPDNPLDFYATPPDVAEALLDSTAVRNGFQPKTTRVLEPSAGLGALALAYAQMWAAWAEGNPEARLQLVLVERDPRRAAALRREMPQKLKGLSSRIRAEVKEGDFQALTPSELGNFDAVIMNPPFREPGHPRAWWDHVRHAISFLARHGVIAAIIPKFTSSNLQGPLEEAFEVMARAERTSFDEKAFASAGAQVPTVGIVLTRDDLEHPPHQDWPETADLPLELFWMNDLRSFRALQDAARSGPARSDEPDSPLRRTVRDLTIKGIRAYDDVTGSLTEQYQRRLTDAVWGPVTRT